MNLRVARHCSQFGLPIDDFYECYDDNGRLHRVDLRIDKADWFPGLKEDPLVIVGKVVSVERLTPYMLLGYGVCLAEPQQSRAAGEEG